MNELQNPQNLVDLFGPLGALTLIIAYLVYQLINNNIKTKKEQADKLDFIALQKSINKYYKETKEQQKEDEKIHEKILNYLKVAKEKYTVEINETQVRILTECMFNNSKHLIYNYTLNILANNHIRGNEKEIAAKLNSFISNKYHQDILAFKEFKYHNKILSNFFDEKWKNYIIETITEIVLKEKGAATLNNTLNNSFDGFKLELLSKVL